MTITEDPTAAQMLHYLYRTCGEPASWEGQCFGLATALADWLNEEFDFHCHAVYGHYKGPVSADGYWKARANLPFIQHGWVAVGQRLIIDPTRWSFEAKEPYVAQIWYPSDEYDEGGNDMRKMRRRPFADAGAYGTQLQNDAPLLSDACYDRLRGLAGEDFTPYELTDGHLMWFANLTPEELGEHQAELYDTLKARGLQGYVPIDNWRAYERSLADER